MPADAIPVGWQSSICPCRAEWPAAAEPRLYRACGAEHESWLLIVGSQEVRKRRLELEKLIRRGLPASFNITLERFGACGTTFHRPPEVSFDPDALDAEMGFYLLESLGIKLTACSDPRRYTDYLANKATRGLTEKMWLEDWEAGRANLWPAELVAQGSLMLDEADALFDVHLDANFVNAL